MMERLPDEVVTPRLLLRRWSGDDVPALGAAIEASLAHLRPWMAWIEFEPQTDQQRSELIATWEREWKAGGDAVYGVFVEGVVVGGCGLHRRRGAGTLEIGYWIHADHVGRGYATELARALTTAAFTIDGIDRVEIHHDRANVRSAAVPRTLGFSRRPDEPDEIQAPAETGIDCTWSMHRDDWVEQNRWDHRLTDRLVLDRVRESDIDAWHRIHADARVWTHVPTGRHTDRETTRQLVQNAVGDWNEAGLGYWSVREQPAGPIIGCGGCRLVSDGSRWNLYYRFAPETHGRGYAGELAEAAITAARAVDPATPVVAVMLEHNTASWRVAEKVGLTRVWVGPDEGNPDPAAVRFVYADRPDVEL